MKTEVLLIIAGIAVYVIYNRYYADTPESVSQVKGKSVDFCPSGTCGYQGDAAPQQQTCGAR
jgi:hypothetical protein